MASYLLESSVCLVVFYLLFLALFSNYAHLVWNRFYLISSLFLSLLIPKLSIPSSHVIREISSKIPLETLDWQLSVVTSTAVSAGSNIFVVVYWTGSLMAFLYLATRFIFIIKKIYSFKRSTIQGVNVLLTDGQLATCVFFKTLLWDNTQQLDDHDQKAILVHELTHIKQAHGYDIILLEAFKIIFWFNPVIYLIERLLKQHHEFLSDKEAFGIRGSNYQNLIVNQVFSSLDFGLTSYFGQSTLRRRILMLQNQVSKPLEKWKILTVVPFISVLMLLFSCDHFDYALPIGPMKADNGSLFVKYDLLYDKLRKEHNDNEMIISGEVSSALGHAKGASIILRGTTIGTISDTEGKFHLRIKKPDKKSELIFSYINCKSLTIEI